MANYLSLVREWSHTRFLSQLPLTIKTGHNMLPEKCIPAHPGVILIEEFLQPMNLTQIAFAKHIGVLIQRVNEIVKGKRGITSETAWLFAQAFGTTPQFWLNLQANHDLARKRPNKTIGLLEVTV
jgi:antitoxin HigA-1